MTDPDRTAEFHGKEDFVSHTIRLAQKYAVAHEVLDKAEIMRRFPMFQLSGNETGYFEPGAGTLFVERCIEAQLEVARAQGATLQFDEKVTDIDVVNDDLVRVVTEFGRYSARKVVLSTGAWIREFIPESERSLFKITRQVFFWYEAQESEKWQPNKFPVFIWVGRTVDEFFYGMPGVPGAVRGVKVGTEVHVDHDSPEAVERTVAQPEIDQMYDVYIRNRLKGLTSKCLYTATCLYTETPDGDFVIDRHPDHANLLVASPCSGHGFKHSAAIGEILADLAMERDPQFDLETMKLARFDGRVS